MPYNDDNRCPDISVVIPTYNRKDYLKQAIASCFVGNETINVEVVVVDDGSTDGTHEYLCGIGNPNVRTFFQEHQGGQVARNRGLEEAKGTYIKFLDDDDWLAKGALTTEVNMLNQSGADVSFAGYAFVEADGTLRRGVDFSEVEDFMAGLLDGRILTHPLRFTYTSKLAKDLSWDEALPCRQDMDFVFQAALYEPAVIRIPQTIAFFRQHEGPRVSSGAAEATEPARVHARLLMQMARKVDEMELWTPLRRRAAARGLWTWAHLIASVDWDVFEDAYSLIQHIYPNFKPDREHEVLAVLDRWGSPVTTERLIYSIRKMKQTLTNS